MDAHFAVTDKYELIALHRALFEAQFSENPLDRDVSGSPLLASLANRLVDALTEIDPRWADWREAEEHPDRVAIAKARLLARPGWASLPHEEKLKSINNQLAPLIPSAALIVELMGDAA